MSLPLLKSILLLFNIVFWISGLSLVWAGIWLTTDLDNYLKLSSEYSTVIPYIFVGTGTAIIFASTLGCSCIVKGQSSLLSAYMGFLVVIIFVEITLSGTIYSYNRRLSDGFEDGLTQNIQSYENSSESTKLINEAQEELHCCGIHSYEDWTTLKPNSIIPSSCCISINCDTSNSTLLYPDGCYEKLLEILNNDVSLIAMLTSGLIFFPMFGAILAWIFATNMKQSKYEPIID